MPSLPISGLPAGGAVGSTDPFPSVQGGVTVRVPASALATFVLNGAPWIIHEGYVSGRTYSHMIRVVAPLATISHTLDTVNYCPVDIPQPVTITSHLIRTGSTNAVAGNANIGLYSNVGGAPAALLQTIATGVAIPGAANTNVTFAPSGGNYTLTPGCYWFGIQMSATVNMLGEGTASALHVFMRGTTNLSSGVSAVTNSFVGYTEAAAFAGGLPNPATPVVSQGPLTSGYLKVA